MRLWSKFVLNNPKLILVATLIVTIFFALQIPKIRISNEIKEFLPSDNPAKSYYSVLTKQFGSDTIMIFGLYTPEGQDQTIFQPRVIEALDRICEKLEQLRFVDRIGDEFDSHRPGWFIWPDSRSDLADLRSSLPECDQSAWDNQSCMRLADHDDLRTLLVNEPTQCSVENRGEGLCFSAQRQFVPKLIERNCAGCTEAQIEDDICARSVLMEDVLAIPTVKTVRGSTELLEDGSEEVVVSVSDLLPSWPADEQEQLQIVKQLELDLFDWETFAGTMASYDKLSTGIMIKLPAGMEIEQKEEIYRQARAIVQQEVPEGIEVEVAGSPVITIMLGEYMQRDLRTMIPLVLLVILATLLVSFRRLGGVALPMLTVIISVIWTVGFMALVGKPMTMITSSIPVVLMAIGTAYTIHMIHYIYELVAEGVPQNEAVAKTLQEVGLAVVMTGVTTVVGFLANATSKVVLIRDFGLMLSLGVAVALIVSIATIPALLVLLPVKARRLGGKDGGWLGRNVASFSMFFYNHRKAVLIAMVAGLPVTIFLMRGIYSDSNFVTFFKSSSEIIQSDQRLNASFGGTSVIDLVFEAEPDAFSDPQSLAAVQGMIDYVTALHEQDPQTYPEPGKSISALSYLKRFHQVTNGGDPQFYRVPETEDQVLDYYFTIGDEQLEGTLDVEDYAAIRVAMQFKEGSTRKFWSLRDALFDYYDREIQGELDWARPGPPEPGLWDKIHNIYNPNITDSGRHGSLIISGPHFLQAEADRMIVTGQITSLVVCLVVVFILCMIIFRSALGGLYAIVPVVVTIGMNFALMGLTAMLYTHGLPIHRIPLEIGTALVSVGAIGMGVDYAIHYLNRFRLEVAAGHSPVEAMQLTAQTAGAAIAINAVSLILGWLVLIFSQFNPMMRMGILTALSMLVAASTTLICYPALFGLFVPRFVKKQPHTGSTTK
ncbi:MAG: MMPL family transporter [Candidatus Alcyoniella australis]|nr:MMPL family transporter [Candidatus Alcyoniella australis]